MVKVFMSLSLLVLGFFCTDTFAMDWEMIPKDSMLKFIATQNNAPVTGQFQKFSGDIHFDPRHLENSHVKITVDITSISASFNELVETLQTPEWFHAKLFPAAIFESRQFKKIDDKHFISIGTLTIRNVTKPLQINFEVLEQDQDRVKIKGETSVDRSAFGLGTGEWASTDEIQKDVKVLFVITAKKISS